MDVNQLAKLKALQTVAGSQPALDPQQVTTGFNSSNNDQLSKLLQILGLSSSNKPQKQPLPTLEQN